MFAAFEIVQGQHQALRGSGHADIAQSKNFPIVLTVDGVDDFRVQGNETDTQVNFPVDDLFKYILFIAITFKGTEFIGLEQKDNRVFKHLTLVNGHNVDQIGIAVDSQAILFLIGRIGNLLLEPPCKSGNAF